LKKIFLSILVFSIFISCVSPITALSTDEGEISIFPSEIIETEEIKHSENELDLSQLTSKDIKFLEEGKLLEGSSTTDSVMDKVIQRSDLVSTVSNNERVKAFLDEFTHEMKVITVYFYPSLYMYLTEEQQGAVRELETEDIIQMISNLEEERRITLFKYVNIVESVVEYHIDKEKYLESQKPLMSIADELQLKKDVQSQLKKIDQEAGSNRAESKSNLAALTDSSYTITEFKNTYNYASNNDELVDPIYHTSNRSVIDFSISGKKGLDISLVRNYSSLNSGLLKPTLELGKSTSSLYYEQKSGNAAVPYTASERKAYIAAGWNLNIPSMDKADIKADVVNERVSSSCSPYTASVSCYRNEYFYKALSTPYEKVAFSLEDGSSYEFHNGVIQNYPFQNVKMSKNNTVESGVSKTYYNLTINDTIFYKFNDKGEIVSKSNEHGDSVTYTFNSNATTGNYNIVINDSYGRKITISRNAELVIQGFKVEDNNQIIKQVAYQASKQQDNVTFRKWTTSGYQNVTESIPYWRLNSVSDQTVTNSSKNIESYTYHNIDSTKLADFNFNVYTPLSGYYANAAGEMLSLAFNNFYTCRGFKVNQCFESHGILSNNKLVSGEIPYLLLNEIKQFNGLTVAFSYANYDVSWRNSSDFTYQGGISRMYQDKHAIEYVSYHPVERVDYTYLNDMNQLVYLSDYYRNVHTDHGVQIDEFWKVSKQNNPRLRNSSRYGDKQATLIHTLGANLRMQTTSNHYYVNGSRFLKDYSMSTLENGYFPLDYYEYSFSHTDASNNKYRNYMTSYIQFEYDPGHVMPKKVSTYVADGSFQYDENLISPELLLPNSSEKVTESFSYNTYGQLVKKIDANGNTTTYEYNGPYKQISKSTFTENGSVNNNVILYSYYPANHTSINNRNQLWKTTETNSYGSPLKSDTIVVEYKEYDAIHHFSGKMTRTSSGWQFSKENVILDKEFTYSDRGVLSQELIKVTLKDGEARENIINRYQHFPSGSLKQITYPDGSILKYERDVLDRITSQTALLDQGVTDTTTVTYNDLQRKVSVTQPDGSIIDEFYTPFGTLQKQQKTVQGYTRVLLRNDVPRGREITRSNPFGQASLGTSYAYDVNGSLVYEANALGQATTYSYANVVEKPTNQIIPQKTVKKVLPNGKSETYFYDKLGQLQSLVEQNPTGTKKITTKNNYSASGKLLSQSIEADGQIQTTNYNYDSGGNLIYLRNAAGDEYTYVYNSLGQAIESYINGVVQKKVKHNEMGWELSKKSITGATEDKYVYKVNGLRDRYIDSKGQTHIYSYTPYNEISRLSVRNGNNEVYWQSYVYDQQTRKLKESINKDNEAIMYQYDAWGRNISKTIVGKTYMIGYDNYDRMTSIEYPDSKIVNYTYDNLNRQLSITYDSLNTQKTYSLANDNVVEKTSYRFQQNREYNHESSVDSFGDLKSHHFLVTTGGEQYNETFNYDSYGNIKQINRNGNTFGYNYDSLNRIKEETGLSTSSYTYNDIGDRSKQSSVEFSIPEIGSKTYSYNALNQLTGYQNNQDVAVYTYYNDGLRATKTASGDFTRYVYINGKVIEELDAQGDTKARNVWNGSMLLFRQDHVNNRGGYFVYNGHGDVVKILDNVGALLKSYDYDIWGNTKSISSNATKPFSNPYRYSGEIFDDESGLIYLRARYYNPSTGRFITKDTYEGSLINPLSQNLYTYVENNPLKYIDPSGHKAEVYTGVHKVVKPAHHASVIIFVDEESEYWNHDYFKSNYDEESGMRYATLGAGPIDGNLVAAYNRPKDKDLGIKVEMHFIDSAEGRAGDDIVSKLLKLQQHYIDYSGAVSYNWFPDSGPFKNRLLYNSNSYVAGLLDVAGYKKPTISSMVPGYNKPLPSYMFGVSNGNSGSRGAFSLSIFNNNPTSLTSSVLFSINSPAILRQPSIFQKYVSNLFAK